MFKKQFSVLLAVLLCISLAACGEMPTNNDGTQQSTKPDAEQGVQTKNSTSDDNVSSETDADGNTIITDENGTITVVDKDGNMIQVIFTEKDGTVVTQNYDKNGNIVSEDRKNPNQNNESLAGQTIVDVDEEETKWTRTYDENGKVKFVLREYKDGSWSKTNYINEIQTEHIASDSDGRYVEKHYYVNGNIKSEHEEHNGQTIEHYYYENGVCSREYRLFTDATYFDINYDKEGNKTSEKYNEADGTLWELTYNSDGSYYGYTYYPDGSVWYNEWDANHNQNLDAQKQIK